MTQIIVDAAMRGKLHDLRQALELCDESGQVLARIVPIANPSGGLKEPPPLSKEEMRRREQEPDFSTAEVLAFLEKL